MEEEGRPGGTSQQDGRHDTQRHSPKPALRRQQPPAARLPMALRLVGIHAMKKMRF
jgi:hypothetical protein